MLHEVSERLEGQALPRWLRGLLILLFAGWVWQGPLRHALWDDSSPPSWNWVLYREGGKHFCSVSYRLQEGEGSRPIERWKYLGYDAPHQMPRNLRVLKRQGLDQHHRLLCSKISAAEGRRVDLRGRIRCAKETGWRLVEDWDRNLCASKKRSAPGVKGGRGKP